MRRSALRKQRLQNLVTRRQNRSKPARLALESLEQRLMMAGDLPDALAVGRTLSSWTVSGVTDNTLKVTYHVYNLQDQDVSGLTLSTSLQPGVLFASASIAPSQNGQNLTWSLGTLPAYGQTSVDLNISFAGAVPLQIESGAIASGTVSAAPVSDNALPAVLRSGSIDTALLASTVDADASDPFIVQKAAELDQDPAKIFAYLTHDVSYESYLGSLRGARGTLWSAAGNALDEASLGVALLRASGVPARYAQGTLSDLDARQLILSMFPDQNQVVGLIPSGTTVADPANDSRLLNETRQHFWIQYDTGTGFVDADTTFANALVGQTFAATAATFSEVPDPLRHKTTVRIKAEITNTASQLFGGGGQSVSTVLEQEFPTVELVGRPLAVGHFVTSSSLPSILFSAVSHTYSPYLALGDLASSPSHARLIRGTDYQEFQTSFPFGSTILTGVFLETVLSGPDGASETFERTLVDRIGFAARQGGSSSVAFTPDNYPALTDLDTVILNVLPGRYEPGSQQALLAELKRNADLFSSMSTPTEIGPQVVATMRDQLSGLLWLQAGSVFTRSDIFTEELAASSSVKAYWDRPRILITSGRTTIDPTTQQATLTTSIDLRRNQIRALAYPGQNPVAATVFQTARGVFDTTIERDVMQAAVPASSGIQVTNTVNVFDAARAQGIPVITIAASNRSQIDLLGVSDEAKARITLAIDQGLTVIVPAQSVTLNNRPTIAWWELNTTTGETIGVTEDGGHQSFVESASAWALGALILWQIRTPLGILLGALGGFFEASVLWITYPINQATNPGGARAQLVTDKTNAIKSFSTAFGLSLGIPAVEAFKFTLKSLLKATLGVDPPVLPYWVGLNLPEIFPGNKDEIEIDSEAGTPGQQPRILGVPNSATTDQNTPISYLAAVQSAAGGRYHLRIQAPDGWKASIDDTGRIVVTPVAGVQTGSFVVRVSAQSVSDPTVAAYQDLTVTINPTVPGLALDLEQDPIFTVPFQGAQLPTAYRAVIRNFGPSAETVDITFPNLPAGFQALTSVSSVTIPAGETAIVGVYLIPTTQVPAVGTPITFEVKAGSVGNPALDVNAIQSFTMPEVHGVAVSLDPPTLNTTPGVPLTTTLTLRSVGNVAETVTFTTELTPGLTIEGLHPVSLAIGETVTLTLTLTPSADVPLNSVLRALITAEFGAEDPQTLDLAVSVVVPGAKDLADAADAAKQLGNTTLAARLDDLSIALTRRVQDPISPIYNSQAIASLDSVVGLLSGDPKLLPFATNLKNLRDPLLNADNSQTVQDVATSIGQQISTLGNLLKSLALHGFNLSFVTSSQVARPNTPVSYTLLLQNKGTETTTYLLSLEGLSPGLSGQLNQSQITLAPGESSTAITATLTPGVGADLTNLSFLVRATVQGAAGVTGTAAGTFTVRSEFVSVISVIADPPFADAGSLVSVSARVLNAVNREQTAQASFVVRNSQNQVIFTSQPVATTLGVLTSISDVSLGTFNTTGLANGNYTIEVTLTSTGGDPIPGGSGTGSLLIGTPVSGSLKVNTDLLPPGTSTVTQQLVVEAQTSLIGPLGVVSQTDVPGAAGLARSGQYVYVGTNTGIQVYDIANPQAPQLTHTVGTRSDIIEIKGDKLYALNRGGPQGGFLVSVYSLTDPSNPALLGTSPQIPYSNAWHMVVTDNHVFVSIWSFSYLLGSNDIKYQTGDILSVDVSNPASPHLDGVLLNTYGTNSDGIGQLLNVDNNGGDGNLWSIVQVDPTTLLVAGSTAAGDNSQVGSGVVHVIDISDPTHMTIVRSLQIPGTVQALGLSIDGNRAIVTGSTGGWNDGGNLDLGGNTVVATLDVSNPRNPSVLHVETLNRASSGPWAHYSTSLGNGLFAFSSNGGSGDQPALYLIDANNAQNPAIGNTTIPSPLSSDVGAGNYLYTASSSGLIIYQIAAPDAIPATAQVKIPKNNGVSVVPGSFSLAPDQVIAGVDFDTYVWNLSLTSTTSPQTITWQTTVADLKPGESRPVSLGGSVSFTSQGTDGTVSLASNAVAGAHLLGLEPAQVVIRPGQAGAYTLHLTNPTTNELSLDLAITGVPAAWSNLAGSAVIPAGGSLDLPFTLTTEALAALGAYGFVVTATNSTGLFDSVEGQLSLAGQPVQPDAESHGLVITVTPDSSSTGIGGHAWYRIRLTNTGSQIETFDLSTIGLPAGVSAVLDSSVEVPPGESNFREVVLELSLANSVNPGQFGFEVRAASLSSSSQGSAPANLQVLNLGVDVALSPGQASDGSNFLLTVTNTGQVRQTYDLSLGGPGSFGASLGSPTVTLDPGQTSQVPVTRQAVGFASPGSLSLVATAIAQGNASIHDADQAGISIAARHGFTAQFSPGVTVLQNPGGATFSLIIENTGNTEDRFEVVIQGKNGPISAALRGLDGQATQVLPSIRLAGLSSGIVLLNNELLALGDGTVTVLIRSLLTGASTTATARLSASASVSTTQTQIQVTPSQVASGSPALLVATITSQNGLPTGRVTFSVDGVAQPSVPISVENGQAVARLQVTNLLSGDHLISAQYEGSATFASSSSSNAVLTVLPPVVPSTTGPLVVGVERYGFHAQPTYIVLRLNADLDPATAQDLSNYRIVSPGRDGRLGTKDDRLIPISQALYDPATRTIALRTLQRLSLNTTYSLIVNGQGAKAVKDVAGHQLDGDHDGQAGGNFVSPLNRKLLMGRYDQRPGAATAKAKPASSHPVKATGRPHPRATARRGLK